MLQQDYLLVWFQWTIQAMAYPRKVVNTAFMLIWPWISKGLEITSPSLQRAGTGMAFPSCTNLVLPLNNLVSCPLGWDRFLMFGPTSNFPQNLNDNTFPVYETRYLQLNSRTWNTFFLDKFSFGVVDTSRSSHHALMLSSAKPLLYTRAFLKFTVKPIVSPLLKLL